MRKFLVSAGATIPVIIVMAVIRIATGWDMDFFAGWFSCMTFTACWQWIEA